MIYEFAVVTKVSEAEEQINWAKQCSSFVHARAESLGNMNTSHVAIYYMFRDEADVTLFMITYS